MFRRKRYSQKPKRNWNALLTRRNMMFLALGILLIIVIVILLSMFRGRKIEAKNTPLYGKREIIVGIAAPSPFVTLEADGTVTGYEKEVAETVIGTAYPNSTIRFVVINDQEASYLLKSGEIDVAIGMFTDGVLKTQGLSSTSGYFQDTILAYVKDEATAAEPLSSLNEKSVRMMTTEIKKSTVTSLLKEKELDIEIENCSSYSDGMEAVQNSNTSALIVSRYKGQNLGLHPMEEQVGMVSYRMLLWRDNKDSATLLSDTITSLRGNGILKSIEQRWLLTPYSAS